MKGTLLLAYGLAVVTAPARLPATPPSSPLVLDVDPAASRVLITVGKAGLFGFAGHAHEVQAPAAHGTITVDLERPDRSVVSVNFDARALRVTGAGEPPADVPEVQRVMLGERVLDVARYPDIAFRSRHVSVRGGLRGRAEVVVDGDLTLHGHTEPVSIRGSATVGADGRLSAHGTCRLRQTAFGIEPVAAAGGTVKVRDELQITVDVVARPPA